MSPDLGAQLREIAADAPPTLPTGDLWERGVRRRRARRAASVLVAGVVLAVVGGLGLQVVGGLREAAPGPVAPTPGTGHLPRTIVKPAPWSEGTSEAGELGPLAVIGSADRKRPRGLFGMVAYEGIYGISATSGAVRFLDLPTGDPDLPGELALNPVLSPDGRKVAYPRYGPRQQDDSGSPTQIGWGIYDAVSGDVLEVSDPSAPLLDNASEAMGFTGDSHYLLATSWPAGVSEGSPSRLLAFDVRTGAMTVLEGPGQRWMPLLGSGPSGAVWSRGRSTYTVDPSTGERSEGVTEHEVVAASYARTGTAFAYIGANLGRDGFEPPWRLYAGPTREQVRLVTGLADLNGFLGWRDADHVVVVTSLQDYAVVNVRDGAVQRESFGGSINLNIPVLAADLWANELVPAVTTPGARDPRTDERVAFVGLVVALGVLAVVLRRRRRG